MANVYCSSVPALNSFFAAQISGTSEAVSPRGALQLQTSLEPKLTTLQSATDGAAQSPTADPSGTLMWTPIMHSFVAASHSAFRMFPNRLAVEKLQNPETKQSYQDRILRTLPSDQLSDIDAHWTTISNALHDAGKYD